MKKLLIAVAVCLSPWMLFAQRTPESFLSQIPAPPAPCGNTQEAMNEYGNRVRQLAEEIKQEQARVNAAMQARADSNKEKVAQDFAKKAGIKSADLMKKAMAGEELTEAEQKQLADEAMAKYGMTMAEGQKVGNMSEKGQENWAKAYGAEAQAKAQADAADPKAAAKRNADANAAGNVMALQQEQKTLAEKVAMPTKRASDKKRALDEDLAAKKILDEIAKLKEERNPLIGAVGAKPKLDAINAQISRLETQYCGNQGTKYAAILAEELTGLKLVVPDYRRLGQVQADLEKAQTGASFTDPAAMLLGAILAYVDNYAPMKYDLLDTYADAARIGKAKK